MTHMHHGQNDHIPEHFLSEYVDSWLGAGKGLKGTGTVKVIEDWINNREMVLRDISFADFAYHAFAVDKMGGSWEIL